MASCDAIAYTHVELFPVRAVAGAFNAGDPATIGELQSDAYALAMGLGLSRLGVREEASRQGRRDAIRDRARSRPERRTIAMSYGGY